jgi:hypothetical protein
MDCRAQVSLECWAVVVWVSRYGLGICPELEKCRQGLHGLHAMNVMALDSMAQFTLRDL